MKPLKSLFIFFLICVFVNGYTYAQAPLKIIVPFTPGGGADQYVRRLAHALEKQGIQAIVENKPGASGVLAADAVARAKPDGQTLLVASLTTLAINPLVFERLSYNPKKDFAAVSLIGYQPAIVVGRVDLPYKTLKEMMDYAKANPNKINRGSTGANTLANLAELKFENAAGITTTHVPFAGDTPALQALIGGAIDIHMTSITAVAPHIAAGKLRVLGVMDSKRLAQVPDAPTFKEAGYDVSASLWYALVAPAAMAKADIERINRSVNAVVRDADFVTHARHVMGMEPRAGNVEETQRFIQNESDIWVPIFKSLNLPKQGG